VLAEKAADAYRNASFEAKAKVSRLEAATRRLFSSRGDDVEKDAATTVERLDRERQASSIKLAKCEDEMADLRRANETLRRARAADRKKHRDAARAFKDELASAAAATRAARDELAAERKNARRKTLEVRTLEAKLFRPEPPSQTKTVSMNTACDSVCDEGMPRLPQFARVPGDAEGSAPPQTEPPLEDEEAAAAEEDTEQAHDEALTDTEIDAPAFVVAEAEAPSRLSVPGSSSGGESSVGPDAPCVVLCVVCVEPEKAVPAPAASAKKLADAEDETHHSHVSSDVSPSFPNDDDDDEDTAGTSRRDASDAPAVSPTEAERMTREKELQKRERFFFARTTVASRSRAGTLDGTLE
jgi:hypothetical protein